MNIALNPINISFRGSRPKNAAKTPKEIDPKYLTPESTGKTIAVMGSVYDGNPKNAEYEKQAFKLGQVLSARGYNFVTCAAKGGTIGALNRGANSVSGKHGSILGILPQKTWDDEDFKTCRMIKRGGDDYTRVDDFKAVADHIIIFPGGRTTMAEAAMFISKTGDGKKEKKLDISLIGPYDGLDSQYDTLSRLETFGKKRDDVYQSYKEIDKLIDEKFPPLNQSGNKLVATA